MKLNTLILTTLAAISTVALNQRILSMEQNSLAQEMEIASYDQSRDHSDITDIFRSDWHRLEVNRPFNENIVTELFEPWPHGGQTSKLMKVVRHNRKTIGFITYYYNADNKRGYCEVGGIAPEYRRKGLANQFFPQIIQDLKERGADKIEIYVKKDNAPSRALYNKYGFEEIEDAFKGTAFLLRKKM